MTAPGLTEFQPCIFEAGQECETILVWFKLRPGAPAQDRDSLNVKKSRDSWDDQKNASNTSPCQSDARMAEPCGSIRPEND